MREMKNKKCMSILLIIVVCVCSIFSGDRYILAESSSEIGQRIGITPIEEDRRLGDLLFCGAELTYDDNVCTFTCNVLNIGKSSVFGTYQFHL